MQDGQKTDRMIKVNLYNNCGNCAANIRDPHIIDLGQTKLFKIYKQN
jgi:hypothetical protein